MLSDEVVQEIQDSLPFYLTKSTVRAIEAKVREATLDEAAEKCDELYVKYQYRLAKPDCAKAIRALKNGESV